MSDQFLNPGIQVILLHIQDPKIQPNSSNAFLAAFPKTFPKANKITVNSPSYIEFVVATSFTPVVIHSSLKQSSERQPTSANNETMAKALEKQLQFFSTLTKEMATPRYSFEKSFFVKQKFCTHDLNEVQKVLLEVPNLTSGIMITSEQGAIGTPRSTDSAYVHRGNLFDLRIRFDGSNLMDVVPGKAWQEKFVKTARFMDSGETYQNYPDLQLKDYLFRYYGANLGKLIRKWDPKGYFNTKQSIPSFIFNRE